MSKPRPTIATLSDVLEAYTRGLPPNARDRPLTYWYRRHQSAVERVLREARTPEMIAYHVYGIVPDEHVTDTWRVVFPEIHGDYGWVRYKASVQVGRAWEGGTGVGVYTGETLKPGERPWDIVKRIAAEERVTLDRVRLVEPGHEKRPKYDDPGPRGEKAEPMPGKTPRKAKAPPAAVGLLPGYNTVDIPMAAPGLISYRFRPTQGSHVAIGATDDADAMRSARRSTAASGVLDVWTGSAYVPVSERVGVKPPVDDDTAAEQRIDALALKVVAYWRFDSGDPTRSPHEMSAVDRALQASGTRYNAFVDLVNRLSTADKRAVSTWVYQHDAPEAQGGASDKSWRETMRALDVMLGTIASGGELRKRAGVASEKPSPMVLHNLMEKAAKMLRVTRPAPVVKRKK